jgi:hypothetical protein
MPVILTGHRARLLATMQKTIYNIGDDGDSQYGIVPSYTVLSTGGYSGTTTVNTPHYAANTISFSHGARQVETATVVATITQAGNATFTVTAANSVNLAAGKAISVAVALADTAILVAGKARTVLAADADVSAFFIVSGTGATVILTAKTAAANDITMNCASIDDTCIGITAAANSANTTAGDVTTHCIYDSIIDSVQSGTTASGTKLITGLTSTAGFTVGMLVTGTGVGAAPNTIASIDSGTQVTLTVNSTATGTVSITFGSLFSTFLTADIIAIKGSTSNDATYTVATGALPTRIIVTESVTAEAAGAYITICKQTTPSNNAVFDNNTGRMWRRYTTSGEKVGALSTGLLSWYDATLCFTLHPADANLSMDAATKTLKIAGAAVTELNRYHVGDLLEMAGFAVGGAGKNNNRTGGYRVVSVTVNGADLDIVLWTGFCATPVVQTGTTISPNNKTITGLTDTSKLRIGMAITGTGVGAASVIASIDSATQITGTVNSTANGTVSVTFTTLATEAAAGSRSIKIVCRTMFAYIAAYNAAGGLYSDWRAPNLFELATQSGISTTYPNATAFPVWPATHIWTSSKTANSVWYVIYPGATLAGTLSTNTFFVALIRG